MIRRWLAVVTLLALVGCDYAVIGRHHPSGDPWEWGCAPGPHQIQPVPVRYRINPVGLTLTEMETIRQGFRAAHAATGVPVDYLGTTTARPASPATGPVIVYVTNLSGAWGRSEPHFNGAHYDGGIMRLDVDLGGSFFRDVVWHEVGHIFGLAHSPTGGETMSEPTAGYPYRTGDLAGFRAVGC